MATLPKPDLDRSVQLFHALSDSTRLSILQRLRFGERCVCDLTDALDAAQSRLSFHLKVLKDAGSGHRPAGRPLDVLHPESRSAGRGGRAGRGAAPRPVCCGAAERLLLIQLLFTESINKS